MKKSTKPIVTHRKVSQEAQKLRKVWKKFGEAVLAKGLKKAREGRKGWENHSEGNLLSLRKELVAHIKKGMLGRKDQEEDIALLAMMVWFHRLEQEARDAILNEWGD